MRHLVSGSAGMIGSTLVRSLLDDGDEVVALDIEPLSAWQMVDERAENLDCSDASEYQTIFRAMEGCERVWSLAFLMGGIGFIGTRPFDCIASSAILTATLKAAVVHDVQRVFVSGSACSYSHEHQRDPDGPPLAEWMVNPVAPEPGYGVSKWFDEQQCAEAYRQCGLETRVARYHNIYSGGPTTWDGGKEKAPAAICRKVAEAVVSGVHEIEIWGDGHATRSYCWIEDCIDGTKRLADSDFRDPLNIGSAEMVSVNQLVSIVEEVAGIECERRYDLTAPQGVRGRSSDNTLCESVLGWAPSTPLRDGIARLYPWVEARVMERHGD